MFADLTKIKGNSSMRFKKSFRQNIGKFQNDFVILFQRNLLTEVQYLANKIRTK
jgi:hypothetical protein